MTETIYVDPNLGDQLEKWCDEPPTDVRKGECLFDKEVTFSDGTHMAIQAIASLSPSSEPIWTQGVLFDSAGHELGMTDVGDSFYGEYHIGDYTCLVKRL